LEVGSNNEAIRVGKHLKSTIITDRTDLTHNFSIDEAASIELKNRKSILAFD
jgi:hypothetical protein